MRILTNYEDLTGKTISFVHAAQFAEAITIATTDNEVIIMNREIDEDEGEGNIRVFPEFRALEYIKKKIIDMCVIVLLNMLDLTLMNITN